MSPLPINRHSAEAALPPRLALLQRLPPRSIGAEIGVFRGDYSEKILNIVQPIRLHLIDPWTFQPDPVYETSHYGARRGVSQQNMDALCAAVAERFRATIEAGTVRIHRAASADASREFPDDYFDWVYIDGNHRYEFVKSDLECYLPKVKPRGYIAGDDYGVPGWWNDGVTRAVDEFIARGLCDQIRIEGTQFCMRRKPEER